MLREDGSLELYESEAEFRAALPGWAGARARTASSFRHVEGAELAALQPGLSRASSRAPSCRAGRPSPTRKLLGKAIWAYAESKGARFVQADGQRRGERQRMAPVLSLSDGTTVSADRLVIAAGAWSHRLAARFGDSIPLETERGYNTTLPARRLRPEAAADLRRPRLRRDAAVDRRARRRRGRARRARRAAQLCAPKAMLTRRSGSCRGSTRQAARSGWASARRCPTRCR